MTKFAGKASYFSVTTGGSGGTERNISTYTRSVDFPLDVADLDVTGFTAAGHERIAGLEDTTITARCVFDDTSTTGSHAVLSSIVGSLTDVIFGPKGSTSGFPKLSATCLCTSASYSSAVDGTVEITATFMLSAATNGWVVGTF